MTKEEYLRKYKYALEQIQDTIYSAENELLAYEEDGCSFFELRDNLDCLAMDFAEYGAKLDRLSIDNVKDEE